MARPILEPLGVGDDTDADHDDVGLDDRTVGEYDTSDMAIVGFESIDTDTGAEVDAVLDVDIGHQRADLLPQDSTERRGHGSIMVTSRPRPDRWRRPLRR